MDKAGVRCPRAFQMNSLEADQWLQVNEPVIGNMIPLDLDLNHAGKEIVPQSQAEPGGEGRSRLTGILPVVDVAATGLLDLRQCFPVPLLAVQLPLQPAARPAPGVVVRFALRLLSNLDQKPEEELVLVPFLVLLLVLLRQENRDGLIHPQIL